MRNKVSPGLFSASPMSTTSRPRAYIDGSGVALIRDPKTRGSSPIAVSLGQAQPALSSVVPGGAMSFRPSHPELRSYKSDGDSFPYALGSTETTPLAKHTAPSFEIATRPGASYVQSYLPPASDLYQTSKAGIRLTRGDATPPVTPVSGSAASPAATGFYGVWEEKPRNTVSLAESVYLDTRAGTLPSSGISSRPAAPVIAYKPLPQIGRTVPGYTPANVVYESPVAGVRAESEITPFMLHTESKTPSGQGRVWALPARRSAEQSRMVSQGTTATGWKVEPAAPTASYAGTDMMARLSRIEAEIRALRDDVRRAQSPWRRGADAVVVEIAMEMLKLAAPRVFRFVQIVYRLRKEGW